MLFLNIITACIGVWGVSWITGSIFKDPARVGESMVYANVACVALGGLILWLTCKPFRAAAEQQDVI